MKKLILSIAIVGGVGTALAQTGTAARTPPQPRAQTTAQPQNGAIQVLDVRQQIRQDLNARRDLSPQAQNIAIVQTNGSVFLRGMVESEDEKRMVEDLAKKSAMNATIVNELTISPQKLLDAPRKELPTDTE